MIDRMLRPRKSATQKPLPLQLGNISSWSTTQYVNNTISHSSAKLGIALATTFQTSRNRLYVGAL